MDDAIAPTDAGAPDQMSCVGSVMTFTDLNGSARNGLVVGVRRHFTAGVADGLLIQLGSAGAEWADVDLTQPVTVVG